MGQISNLPTESGKLKTCPHKGAEPRSSLACPSFGQAADALRPARDPDTARAYSICGG